MTRRRHVALFAATVACSLAAAFAPPAFAVGALVDVSLVDRAQGDVLSVHDFRGASWVAGRPGSRYAVRLVNRSPERVLVVLSIDGVNAISGETAATGQTGYVLAPYQTSEITGWRKSQTEAAAFYFTALPDSYAARTDRPDHVGVIGVASFREKATEREIAAAPPPWRAQEGERRDSARASADAPADVRPLGSGAASASPRAKPAAPSALAEKSIVDRSAANVTRDERLGTGHGEREYSPTSRTTFERASERPNEVVRIRYDSYGNLLANGVIRPRPAPALPDPFPSFVPDPKG